MNRPLLFLLMLASATVVGQSRMAALNNFTESANRSSAEVSGVFSSLKQYYPRVKFHQNDLHFTAPRFECGLQPEEYYIKKALTESSILNDGGTLNYKLRALQDAEAVIDTKCKALDIYHKLEDYKRDNFKQADKLMLEMSDAFKVYHQKQNELSAALEAEWKKQAPATGGLVTTDKMMRREIARERAFLDLWTFNLHETVHTGWPVDQLQTSIAETDKAVNLFAQTKTVLEYPASTMYGSFQEGLATVLSGKRSGLDGYNFEAKQSDRHSNEVYLLLINYFDGMLVADQNAFVRFAAANGYKGAGCIDYSPVFEIRTNVKETKTEIVPFKDITRVPVKPTPQPTAITAGTATILDNYIEFLNESNGELEHLMRALERLNGDANYLKVATTYKGKGKISFNHDSFKVPLSDYQKAVAHSAPAQPSWRKSLDDQATVLINIIKEMDQIASVLEVETASKAYEKDSLTRVYTFLEREVELARLFFEKRELLYTDARTVFESYAIPNPAGSWAKSGKVLLAIVDEQKTQFFKAKKYILGDSTSLPQTTKLDAQIRDAITNEFANLKGIENLGGSNGNDPYTPYERIPQNARTNSEDLNDIKQKSKSTTAYRGPFHDYQYMFNAAVREYNKFTELSKVRMLQHIYEPELFILLYPKKQEKKKPEPVVVQPAEEPQSYTPIVADIPVPDAPQVLPAKEATRKESRRGKQKNRETVPPAEGRVIHDTVKITDIIRIETRSSDTVYIEKHDTIYREGPGEKLLSLDGYASNNLVFLLDVSGSMSTGQKLPLLKKSMLLLLKILRPEDNVSIVVYSGKARAVLAPTSAREQEKIRKVIENLRSEGATDGNAGIKLAYKTADGSYIRGGNNRIILATDGEFPISDETIAMIRRYGSEDIFLSIFNFGSNAVSAASLKTLADLGKGNFAAITAKNSDVKLIAEAKGKKK